MGRREQYSFDDITNDSSPFPESRSSGRKRGIYVSQGTIAVYILLSILFAALVGLIVNFARPCERVQCNCVGYQNGSTSSSKSSAAASSSSPTSTKPTGKTPPEITTPKSTTTSSSSATTHAWTSTSYPFINTTSDSNEVEDDALWQKCVNMSWQRQQCFSDAFPCPKEDPVVDYRLPQTFFPIHYKIELQPDIYQQSHTNFSFSGSVSILLSCQNSSDVIFVHFRSMTINDSSVSVRDSEGSVINLNQTSIDLQQEFFKIHLERKISVGENVTVYMEFHGPIDQTRMTGMYFSDYFVGNQTKYMLATQFESTDARKAFPCLDEPMFKATFEVTLWRKEPMVALTNMPKVSSTNMYDGWIADYFGTTPVVMSTYLMAFAIADYTYIEGVANNSLSAKHLRHWSRPDFIEQGFVDYSLEVCITMFDYFETYFDFPFDMPKEDQISINDFDAGAMENWGLITYREGRMVWDPNHSTLYEKQRMTGTLAHELLHQWLGNLVTCSWWNDLWLQEGMARYHQHLAMKAAQPTWDVDQIFAAQVLYRALRADQTGHSHPIHTFVSSPEEIDMMFSPITYDKAGCIIRMMKEIVLKDSYHDAMRNYVKDHAYGVTNFLDLLQSWDTQAMKDGLNLDVNTTHLMLSWILQLGYPIVHISRLNNNTISMEQMIFLENPQRKPTDVFPTPFNYLWDIPITYVTKKHPTNMTVEWLHYDHFREASLAEDLSEDDWLLGNYMQYGFYRVNYDKENWLALGKQLQSDHDVFNVLNRGQILSDSFYISKAGYIDHVTHLELTSYMTSETDYLPWHVTADTAFSYFEKIFRNHEDYSIFREYGKTLLQPHYDRLGWDERPLDTHHDIYLRDLVLTHLCRLGHSDCIQKAQHYFMLWRQDPDNTTIIRPDIRDAVYCTAIRHGLVEDWDFLFEEYRKFDHFSREKMRRRHALTCSDDRPTLTRLFTWAAEYDKIIQSHDPRGPSSIMRSISRSSIGQYISWEYINNNWDIVPNRFNTLAEITERFSSDFDIDKYDKFVADHPAKSETETFHYEDMRLIITQNNKWRKQNEHDVFTWLRKFTDN